MNKKHLNFFMLSGVVKKVSGTDDRIIVYLEVSHLTQVALFPVAFNYELGNKFLKYCSVNEIVSIEGFLSFHDSLEIIATKFTKHYK